MSASKATMHLATLLALALGSGCVDEVESPSHPNVAPLVTSYDAPSGTFDPASPGAWLEKADTRLAALGGGRAELVFSRIMDHALRRVDDQVLSPGGDVMPTRIAGTATLEVSCGDGSDAKESETARVTVAIENGKLPSLVWGETSDCPLWKLDSLRMSYAGRFTLYRYPTGDLLVKLEGANTSDKTSMELDFRIGASGLESRVETPTGDVIATPRGSTLLARAANGTFVCDPVLRTCR